LGLFAACFAFVGGAFIASAPSARASLVIWSLQNFEFETGGTATGSFGYDAMINEFSAINITTSSITNTAKMYGMPTGLGNNIFFDTTNTGMLALGVDRFLFSLDTPMTDAGGMIFANISSVSSPFGFPFAGEGICGPSDPNAIPSGTACTIFLSERRLTDGAFILGSPASNLLTATPLPAALPLFASALGLLSLLGWRRKRNIAAV
jgi:hypothetical protein